MLAIVESEKTSLLISADEIDLAVESIATALTDTAAATETTP
jgi:hypothetical protein